MKLKSKGMSPFSTFNNGDPKLNSDMFNHAMGMIAQQQWERMWKISRV